MSSLSAANNFSSRCENAEDSKYTPNPLSPAFAIILAQGLQRYYSPADWARKLFKPFTDSPSLLVEIEKKFFVLGLWFSGKGRRKWGCHFHFIGLV